MSNHHTSIATVVVIGAGTMGRGIAQWFAQQGVAVQLTDANQKVLDKSRELIVDSWQKLKEKGKFTQQQVENFEHHLVCCSFEHLNSQADLVVEAIIEDLEIKSRCFAQLDDFFSEQTVFASNTSSIPICAMAKNVSPTRKNRFIGLHFFNPATIMKLVEVIKTPWSDETILSIMVSFFKEKGKIPAICQDRPGFIVNRVARNFYGEALRIAQVDNEERFKTIDETLKQVGGFKMGPFELMDLIGIDVNFQVTQSVWKAFYQEPRFAPHQLQKLMVDSGRYGRKTKQGFYRYDN